MARVRCALSFHPVTETFDRPILVRRLNHVQVMEPHRRRVMSAHAHATRRAGIEHFLFVELLAMPADAAVVVWAW